MKHVMVCGAAGFIGVHLVARLKAEGCFVEAIDRKVPDFGWIDPPHHFECIDLRMINPYMSQFHHMDEVYQLAAEVGGLGYIMDRNNDAEMLCNSVRINLNVLDALRYQVVLHKKSPRVFFAASACIYPSMHTMFRLDPTVGCRESDAYPANPDNEYAWEKLFSERLYDAYARNHGVDVHVGRVHNCFGTHHEYDGGREKAPAAICRKVALAQDGGYVELWGDGNQTRSFMYVDDAVEGMIRLTRSDFRGPVNIGSSEMVTLNELVHITAKIAGKRISIRHVDGPVGVRGRSSDNTLIKEKLGWEPSIPLAIGMAKTYGWVADDIIRKGLTQPAA